MGLGKKQQIGWINCAKFFAILAVVIDHVKGILYEDEAVQYIFFYSVTVFLFLAGMTAYYSLQNRKPEESFGRWVVRRIGGILVPYLAAVAVYQYVRTGFQLNLGAFVLWAVNFNLEGQFYYVLIYIQLIAAAPVLYLLVMNCRRGKASFLFRGIFLVLAWFASMFCMKHTFALETYGGGKYLLGGTYLFVFAAGMVAADMHISLSGKKKAGIASAASVVLLAGAMAFLLHDRLAWDESMFGWLLRVNPPGITLILYSLAVIFFLFSVCTFLAMLQNRVVDKILQALQYLGKYTLYIFLYHTLILDTLLPKLTFLDNGPAFLKILVYMAGMLLLPLAGKNLYDWLKRAMVRKTRKEEMMLKEK